MTTDALMLLHYLYRKYYDEIEARKIQFFDCLNNLLMNNRNEIEVKDIENLIEEVLESKNEDFKTINMERLSAQL